MTKTTKQKLLAEEKRLEFFSKDSKCPICKANFRRCPHSFTDARTRLGSNIRKLETELALTEFLRGPECTK